jgi:hypothetical protein
MAIMGPSVYAMVVLGWLFFAANAVLAALIARRLAGRRAFQAMLLIFLSVPLGAMGIGGAWLTYPVTHNSTMTCALACVLLALGHLDRGGRGKLAAIGFLATIAGISDPWFVAAFTVPLLVAIWPFLRGSDPVPRRRGRALAAIVLIALGLTKLKLLGLVWFLPGAKSSTGGGSFLLGQVQAALQTFLLLAGGEYAALGLAFLVAAALVFAFMRKGAVSEAPRADDLAVRFVPRLVITSCVLVLLSFLASRFAASGGGGRYLVNIVYLAPLGVIAFWAKRGAAPAWPIVPAAFYLLIGLATTPALLPRPGADFYPEARQVVAALEARNLTNGYGRYFIAANANAIDVLSGGRIAVRPVNPDDAAAPFVPFLGQGSALWYSDREIAEAPSRSFLILDPVEECPDMQACVSMAGRQFGAPASSFTTEGLRILVWNRSLVSDMAAAHVRERTQWRIMNNARTIADIKSVCAALHVHSALPLRLYARFASSRTSVAD